MLKTLATKKTRTRILLSISCQFHIMVCFRVVSKIATLMVYDLQMTVIHFDSAIKLLVHM